MSPHLTLTVLVENTANTRALQAEHGLAFHLQHGPHSLLFDTGQSALITHNAQLLGIDLSRLEAIALSHGHYDHTGGLAAVRQLAPHAPLHTLPAALQPHYARNPDASTRSVGIPQPSLAAASPLAPAPADPTTPVTPIPGVFLTGSIPRTTTFEDVGGPFVLDADGSIPDPIDDDQALFFDTADGVVILLGCAHAGVVNTVQHVRHLTRNRPVHAVLGGMHLLEASPHRLDQTVEFLRQLQPASLAPAHCTGIRAAARLWTEFPHQCTSCSVGTRFVFHL